MVILLTAVVDSRYESGHLAGEVLVLSPYRVLDLCDDRGHLAAMLLAQLGADVIAVEPPNGQGARQLAPFAHDVPGRESSLVHRAYNRGKRSVVMDPDGAQFDALVASADIVIESGAVPVDLERLRSANPTLITVSISGYGSDGPKSDWAAVDLTVAAASGTLALTGDRDRPPVRISLPQTWHFAALDAMTGALFALWERHRSGRGQHVDVSAQESFISANQFQTMYPLCGQQGGERLAGGMQIGPVVLHFLHRCLDGYVTVGFLFGPIFGPYSTRLFEWIHSEAGCDRSWAEQNWIDFGLLVSEDPAATRLLEEGSVIIDEFMATKTKAELLEVAIERRLLLGPALTTRELLDLDHSVERDFWDTVDGLRYPGRFANSGVPLTTLGRAPHLGEHTTDVLDELPTAGGATTRRRAGAAPDASSDGPDDLPLAGVKVLDFAWALAGPATTRLLADHGATVIRVESQAMPDAMRGAGPFLVTDGGPEDSLQWHSANASKMGFTANLKMAESRPVIMDLVTWADVVVESFAAGKLGGLGYGYEELVKVNPYLIMLSSCLMGQTGSLASYSGFGTMGAAVAGFYPVVGWPDRDPCGPLGAYSDYMSPRFTSSILIAALEHRRRTGQGQYIDYSQMEAAAHLLTVGYLDDQSNDRVATRIGNRDLNMAPNGVYPVAGDDRWIALACTDDRRWHRLATLLGRHDLSELSTSDRLDRQDELDQILSVYTSTCDGEQLESTLQDLGIAAQRVLRPEDVVVDDALVARRQFQQTPHPIHGTSWVETSAFKLRRTPGRPAWAGPTFGQHLWEVLTEVCGYDEETAASLIATGAFE